MVQSLTLLVLWPFPCVAQSTLSFEPAVTTDCDARGLGIGSVAWSTPEPGPILVHVNSADGPPLTGPSDPAGQTMTGYWVRDGMIFVLTDLGGRELARVTARVSCGARGEIVRPALAQAPYLPLQVGNEWMYISNTRLVTGDYFTRRITRAEIIGGVTWFVMEESRSGATTTSESRFRVDDAGRVYRLSNSGEQLWLDPNVPPDPRALLKIDNRQIPVTTPAGRFENTVHYSAMSGNLIQEFGAIARGVGQITVSATMISGSSGGFVYGYNLFYAKIDGRLIFAAPGASIELTADATSFDVTNKAAANCALPCYFAACGLVGNPDPPGTYKPCFGARVRWMQPGNRTVELDLLNSAGQSLFHAAGADPFPGDAVIQQSIPLYSAPSQPFAPGVYYLRAQTPDGRVATLPIQVR